LQSGFQFHIYNTCAKTNKKISPTTSSAI
jgi:hypothetical protein